MDITDPMREVAEARLTAELEGHARAIRARYDRRISRIVVELDNGLELAFSPRLAQGLTHATSAQLSDIEITPLGDGLHWPALDADLYIPGLIVGIFGTRQWMEEHAANVPAPLTKDGNRRRRLFPA